MASASSPAIPAMYFLMKSSLSAIYFFWVLYCPSRDSRDCFRISIYLFLSLRCSSILCLMALFWLVVEYSCASISFWMSSTFSCFYRADYLAKDSSNFALCSSSLRTPLRSASRLLSSWYIPSRTCMNSFFILLISISLFCMASISWSTSGSI